MSQQDFFLFLLHIEQISQEKPSISLGECVSQFQATHPNFQLSYKNWGHLQCYALIVLPWEQLKKKLPKKQMLHQLNHYDWGSFEVVNTASGRPYHKMDLRYFLRKLRNATSHGRVAFRDNGDVLFRDSDGTKIRFTQAGLQRCMQQLADVLRQHS